MGRHREFDTDAVLDAAVDVFWRRGFEATSIDHLEAATGLRRQSLYGAFGDKERLFLAALRRYHERIGGQALEAMRDPDPRRGVARLFEVIAERMIDPGQPGGCFVADSALETRARSEAIRELVAASIGAMEAAIHEACLRGQQLGQLPPDRDTRALARFLTGTAQGMAVMARVHQDPAVVREMAKLALSAWDHPGGRPVTIEQRPTGRSSAFAGGRHRTAT